MQRISTILTFLFRKHLKLTWLVSSKTPTCVLFTPSESQLCQRTSNSPAESVENVHKLNSRSRLHIRLRLTLPEKGEFSKLNLRYSKLLQQILFRNTFFESSVCLIILKVGSIVSFSDARFQCRAVHGPLIESHLSTVERNRCETEREWL